jgi:hypothetical protein
MDITTVIAIAGLVIAMLNAGVSVWAWRRRRATADLDRIRSIMDLLRKSIGEGSGLHFNNHGAFIGEDREAFEKLRVNIAFVVDGQLRQILTELTQEYDAAEASAITFEIQNKDQPPFEIAARRLDPNDPATKAAAVFKRALDRLAVLERRASGLLPHGEPKRIQLRVSSSAPTAVPQVDTLARFRFTWPNVAVIAIGYGGQFQT